MRGARSAGFTGVPIQAVGRGRDPNIYLAELNGGCEGHGMGRSCATGRA
jgi:hypothetical protein